MQSSVNDREFDTFEEILQAIDFSIYVDYVMTKLRLAVRTQYDGPIFIYGDNIENIEILRYECTHEITIVDFNNKIIPRSYRKNEFPLIQDVTAD